MSNKVYEFGSSEDVAKTTEGYAQNTVVLKVEGNLTINKDITLTSVKSSQGFGGPKGMIIYCTEILTNEGIISMTARGAKAIGQNVYLWKNSDGSFEYVPAQGGTGGASVSTTAWKYKNGIVGAIAPYRGTGGGGSGACMSSGNDNPSTSGKRSSRDILFRRYRRGSNFVH